MQADHDVYKKRYELRQRPSQEEVVILTTSGPGDSGGMVWLRFLVCPFIHANCAESSARPAADVRWKLICSMSVLAECFHGRRAVVTTLERD